MNRNENKRRRPDWYLRTIRRFRQYSFDKARLESLLQQPEYYPQITTQYRLSPTHPTGHTSDQICQCAVKQSERERDIEQLDYQVKEVEIVLDLFSEDRRKLIELRYMNHASNARDWQVALKLKIPLRSYYLIRDELIISAAAVFGYCKREQVGHEELQWHK